MKQLKYLFIVFLMMCLCGNKAFSQVFSFENDSDVITTTLPRGVLIKTHISQTVSSERNNVGDPVYFSVINDLSVGNVVCVPKDSVLSGRIVQLAPAKQGRNGFFLVLLNRITFPDGWSSTMAGKISTGDGTGVIGGEITELDTERKVPHYIEGIGGIVQLVKAGDYKMGKEKSLIEGQEVIISLEGDLKVQYLENFE